MACECDGKCGQQEFVYDGAVFHPVSFFGMGSKPIRYFGPIKTKVPVKKGDRVYIPFLHPDGVTRQREFRAGVTEHLASTQISCRMGVNSESGYATLHLHGLSGMSREHLVELVNGTKKIVGQERLWAL